MASAELSERGPIDLAKVPGSVQDLIRRLDATATTDTATAQLEIMAAILNSTSLEDIFAAANAGTESGKDWGERQEPFLITGWEVKRSAPGFVSQGGFPFYYLLRVKSLENGREAVVTCGGYTFVSVMDALDRNGHLEAAEKAHGGFPMRLESRTMQGSGYDVIIPHPHVLTASS